MSTQIFPVGIVLGVFSFIIMLLVIPPLCWHCRNGNTGATFFVGWAAILLLFNFINPIIWSSDDTSNWFSGRGLCDVEVKIQLASQIGFPVSFSCVLRALAGVMDTERMVVSRTRGQEKRSTLVDLSICIFFPVLQMMLHFVVQPNRYYVFGISGCAPSIDDSWLAVVLILLPPVVWLIIDAYFSALILIRLNRYRINFSTILASANTSKSRFLRLYLICIIWILASLVIWIYEFTWNVQGSKVNGFHWSETHAPSSRKEIILVPSGGKVLYDRWVWLTAGLLVFLFFGFGQDAVDMYMSALAALRFNRVCSCLKPKVRSASCSSSASSTPSSSITSKTRMLWNRMTAISISPSWRKTSGSYADASRPQSALDSSLPGDATPSYSVDEMTKIEQRIDASPTSSASDLTNKDVELAGSTPPHRLPLVARLMGIVTLRFGRSRSAAFDRNGDCSK